MAKPIKHARRFENICRLMKLADENLGKERPVVSKLKTIPFIARDAGGQQKVLIVQDGRINRRVATLQLVTLGYLAEPVESGEQALEALANDRYDIVLMDCDMPGMDGYETTRQIRIGEGSATHTVVVAMTAHAMEGARAKCLAAGMDDYISKPVKIGVLGAIIERWCGPLRIAPPAAVEAIVQELAFGPELDASAPEFDVSAPEFDVSAIDELQTISSANPVVVREIIDMFLADLPEQVALIKFSQASGDLPAVGAVAHSLKGASQGVGASRLADVCTHLEIFARAGSALRVSALTDRLEKETALLRPLLEEELIRRT
jgi:CheY-like chemotaxis protein